MSNYPLNCHKTIRCARCGKLTDKNAYVSPVDKNGRNLEQVELCYNCIVLWKKYYNSKENSMKNTKDGSFHKKWATRWIQFMNNSFEKEKVDFT